MLNPLQSRTNHPSTSAFPLIVMSGFERPPLLGRPYHIAQQRACKSNKLRCAEFILPLMIFMPPQQAALRTALVRPMAFAHHKAQEKGSRKHRTRDLGEMPDRAVPINIGERCGGE